MVAFPGLKEFPPTKLGGSELVQEPPDGVALSKISDIIFTITRWLSVKGINHRYLVSGLITSVVSLNTGQPVAMCEYLR